MKNKRTTYIFDHGGEACRVGAFFVREKMPCVVNPSGSEIINLNIESYYRTQIVYMRKRSYGPTEINEYGDEKYPKKAQYYLEGVMMP